jgi:outer membrane protein TolC
VERDLLVRPIPHEIRAGSQDNVQVIAHHGIAADIESLDLARSDYAKGNVDYATVLSTVREVLQVELQVVQVEAELGKALASLERAVGCQINEHPPQQPVAESRRP